MLDTELQIVDSEVVDVSENASQVSASFTLGRRGFTRDATFFIHLEAVSADTTLDPITFLLEAVVDGTNYFPISTIKLYGNTALAKTRIWQAPIGLWDLRDEVQGINDLKVRVTAFYVDGAVTDDFTYSAYIGSPASYAHNNVI